MIDIVSQTEKLLPCLEENLRAHIKWKQHGGPCEIPNGLAFCAIHHKAFDKGSIGLDENMRVLVSDAVNGGGIVERLFWYFDGKTIALPHVRKKYPF